MPLPAPKMLAVVLAIVSCGAMPSGARAQASAETLRQGQPAPVVAVIDRMAGCSHFAGEEPYDAVRRAFIAKAMHNLRCTALVRDEARLRRRYAKAPAVLRALDAAHDIYD